MTYLYSFMMLTGYMLTVAPMYARDLHASLPYLPSVSETPDRGAFINLVKAIDELYSDGQIVIKVFPFQRSLMNIIDGKADFHLPLFKNPAIPPEKLPYRHISVPMGKVVLILYSHIDHPLTKDDLLQAKTISPYPYRIETDRGLLESLAEFPIQAQLSVEQMFRKLDAKRIDGFIFAQEDSDAVLKTLKIKTIQRVCYQEFEDFIVVPKNEHGEEMDRLLSEILRTLHDEGRLQQLWQKIHLPYQEWQPAAMDW